MHNAADRKMKWIFIGLLFFEAFPALWKSAASQQNTTEIVFCSYRFGRHGSVVFSCNDNETCCDDECCSESVPFYKLWYFWFTIIAVAALLSGITYICYQRCKRLRAADVLRSSAHVSSSIPLKDLQMNSNEIVFQQ